VEYFHLVFTVPHALTPLAAAQPRLFYTLLFRAVREALQELAGDPRHLGATIGGVMVLHTWGQNLSLHPHVHVIAPGGGLSSDGRRFVRCPRGFFLPVKALGRLFRGKLLAFLGDAWRAGQLSFRGSLSAWNDPRTWNAFLSSLYASDWVVYSQPPVAGPQVVLKYLARYTHRVAISNERIERIADRQVTFRYKDYARRGRTRRLTLSADEFLRRFLAHVLPRGLVRIRSFGLLANRGRGQRLARCRKLLGAAGVEERRDAEVAAADDPDALRCPRCAVGPMYPLDDLPRPTVAELVARTYTPTWPDTS
jgi:hypothetical protein